MCGEVCHLREASELVESGLTQSASRIVDSTALAIQATEPRVVVGVEVTKNQNEWCGFQSVIRHCIKKERFLSQLVKGFISKLT